MKKITLLVLLAGLFLSLNAQQIKSTNNRLGEKISPDKFQQIQNLKTAKNIDLGWVYMTDDIYANVYASTGAGVGFSQNLFPDSTVVTVNTTAAGVSYVWNNSAGQVIDPYSVAFDPNLSAPLIQPGIPYYVDSVGIIAWYEKRNASIDTLIFEFVYNQPLENNAFHSSFWVEAPDSFFYKSPKMMGSANQFGYEAKLTDPAKVVIKHVLTDSDTTLYYGKNIAIPVGINVPANQIIGVNITFVPGYTYVFGDTIHTYGTGAVQTSHLNEFLVPFQSYDVTYANCYYDPFGANLNYGVTTSKRYKTTATYLYQFSEAGFDIGWNIEQWTGVKESSNSDVKVFPNPSTGIVNIELLNSTPATANFYNLLGEQVKSVKLNNTKTAVNLSGNASGIYMLRIEQGNNIITKKVILK